MEFIQKIEMATAAIRKITDFEPEIGMVLGSGLGAYANQIENPVVIPYEDIPEFPVSTVAGHEGQFILGEHLGKKVIAMQGRVHFYEGYSQREITMPIRIMRQLGVKKVLLTNAAGGVNTSFPVGSLMVITDHINNSGSNPLVGPNLDEFGTRFPDMSNLYTEALRDKLKTAAKKADIPLVEGVYMMFSGPNYETPAEVKMARNAGADAVGMSTVPEAIVARHCGMEVVGVSCITNFAAGIKEEVLNHKEVVEVTTRVNAQFVCLLDILLKEVL